MGGNGGAGRQYCLENSSNHLTVGRKILGYVPEAQDKVKTKADGYQAVDEFGFHAKPLSGEVFLQKICQKLIIKNINYL